MMTDDWLNELMKHPFISSKTHIIILIEKHGKGIFLMKSKSKTIRKERQQKTYPIGLKMTYEQRFEEEKQDSIANVVKRKKMGGGQTKEINMGQVTPSKSMIGR